MNGGHAVPRPVLPLRDVRFWVLIGLMLVLSVTWVTVLGEFDRQVSVDTLDFLPLGIFLAPVLYAAVTFGLPGAMSVAGVGAVSTVPLAISASVRGDSEGAWIQWVEVILILVVAYFVGRAVRTERRSRARAERSRLDQVTAAAMYHDLFDTNSQPILLVDPAGVVRESNVAAETLFGNGPGSLRHAVLADLFGEDAASMLDPGSPASDAIELAIGDGEATTTFRWVSRAVQVDGRPMFQVVLQDVTEEARRQQRAREYASSVLRGQEEERRRIAQELHDGPLQSLVHLVRLIDRLGTTRASPVPVTQLRSTTESVVAEIRRISRGLRPSLLDDLGLRAALERLCDDTERRAGVAVSVSLGDEIPRLTPAAEVTVYRIAQEALSNVAHHAEASTVEVALGIRDSKLVLQISDDGGGFDAEGLTPDSRRLGLSGMSERAELVGGALQVRSWPGRGTVVRLSLPTGDAPDQPTLR